MKKQSLLFLAGGMLAFAACNTENTGGMSDAQIDSTVNARVDSIRIQMMMQNDSLINAMAVVKADSIIAAMKGGSSVTRTTTTTTKVGKGGTTTTTNPGSVTNRPGATDNKPAPVTDRPGATENKPRPVTDRPGSN